MFFIVGMLGEYISRILIEIQDRPAYTTSSIEIHKARYEKEASIGELEVAASKQEG
ncbi:hypothetical protein D3C80_2123890 [compost metagenome]